ncbi:hypothetical protein FPHOBKDP_00064 [Listeria phage LPJP1]|nr:hypothetical protein FPHOBKDP_00064 [Listeria phage LPJP1]
MFFKKKKNNIINIDKTISEKIINLRNHIYEIRNRRTSSIY